MEGGQSSDQLRSEDKRCLQGHLGAPNHFHKAGSGGPCDDSFPFLPSCQQDDQKGDQTKTKTEQQGKTNADCRPADLVRAQEQCHVAFQGLAWAKCATRVALKPFLLSCAHNLCESGGRKHALCESLQAFGAACQAQGLKPPIWRNSSFCRECPL